MINQVKGLKRALFCYETLKEATSTQEVARNNRLQLLVHETLLLSSRHFLAHFKAQSRVFHFLDIYSKWRKHLTLQENITFHFFTLFMHIYFQDSDEETMSPSDIIETFPIPEQYNLSEILADSPPLHSSSTWTLLETLVHLFHWFSSHPSISKEAFSRNLQMWHSILPEGNCLHTSY